MVAGVASPKKVKKKNRTPTRFWLGAFFAGGCFAMGFGITQRVIILQNSGQKPAQESFAANTFPGEPLEVLRLRHGGSKADLKVNFASQETKLAPQKQTQQEQEKLKAIARRQEEGIQAALEALKNLPRID